MEIHVSRRHLPHWRMDGATYAVTWRLHRGPPPLSPGERDQVVSALRHFDSRRYAITVYDVMDDHVHVIVTPLDAWALSAILHSWKSFTAQTWLRGRQREGAVWQDESYDRIVRDEEELLRTVEYLLDNPFRRWPDIDAYPWRGLGSGADNQTSPR